MTYRIPMATIQKLSTLIQNLEQGGNSLRLFAARAAFNFKHSWLEMAEALVEVRNSGQFKAWGFTDFLEYCHFELGLKKAVVDKLVVSFSALREYAPERLTDHSEEAPPLPSMESLDYFARAVGAPRIDGNPSKDAPEDALSPELSFQLHKAVFEENCAPKQLRERFDPVIRPKPPARQQHEAAKKAMGTAKKLLEQLQEIEGLPLDILREAEVAVTNLQVEMAGLIEALRRILDVDEPV